MKRTRLQLETCLGSKLGILTLTRALAKFEGVAEALEAGLLPHLDDNQWIMWRMTYNWSPDDGKTGREMTPEYQPLLFGNVCVVNGFGWQQAICGLTLNVDCFSGDTIGCTLDNCSGESVALGADETAERLISELHKFMKK